MTNGDTYVLSLERRDGQRGDVLVDAEDAELVKAHRWSLTAAGYAQCHVRLADGRRVNLMLHRLLLGLEYGDPREGDHIDRDRSNYRRSNLRIVTPAQNGQNRGSNRGAASRYRGVTPFRGKWQASCRVNGRLCYLGRYVDEAEAARVAAEFRAEHLPFSEEALAS